jgi:hypothetical protein
MRNYFELHEFNGVMPEPELLELLNRLRHYLEKPVVITSGPREVHEHVLVYKEQYGEEWHRKIPWRSRHLPTHKTAFLRAVDIISDGSTGEQMKNALLRLRNKYQPSLRLGLGVGKRFVHVDVDRKGDVKWDYDY